MCLRSSLKCVLADLDEQQKRTLWHPVHCAVAKGVTFWDVAYNWGAALMGWKMCSDLGGLSPGLLGSQEKKPPRLSFLRFLKFTRIVLCGAFFPPKRHRWNLWEYWFSSFAQSICMSTVQWSARPRVKAFRLVLQDTLVHHGEFFSWHSLTFALLIFQLWPCRRWGNIGRPFVGRHRN